MALFIRRLPIWIAAFAGITVLLALRTHAEQGLSTEIIRQMCSKPVVSALPLLAGYGFYLPRLRRAPCAPNMTGFLKIGFVLLILVVPGEIVFQWIYAAAIGAPEILQSKALGLEIITSLCVATPIIAVSLFLEAQGGKQSAAQNPDVDHPAARFSFRHEGRLVVLNPEEILYVAAARNGATIHTEEEGYSTALSLKQIHGRLAEPQFLQVHRGFLVNAKHIAALRYRAGGAYMAFLSDGDETPIPVGRTFASRVRAILKA